MEKTIGSREGFAGRALRLEVVDIELADGTRSVREIIRHPGAVVVLAELADGRFVFVRQYRKAIEMALLEAVAGTLEPGEDPEACARRELQEESGYRASTLTALGRIVPAPGYSSEWLYLYHARTEDGRGEMAPDEDERITVELYDGGEIDAMIRSGALLDAKTLAAWGLYRQKMG